MAQENDQAFFVELEGRGRECGEGKFYKIIRTHRTCPFLTFLSFTHKSRGSFHAVIKALGAQRHSHPPVNGIILIAIERDTLELCQIIGYKPRVVYAQVPFTKASDQVMVKVPYRHPCMFTITICMYPRFVIISMFLHSAMLILSRAYESLNMCKLL